MLVGAPLGLLRDVTALPASMVYAASSRICHQLPDRSFELVDVYLPVCARCFGLYASGTLGALLAWTPFRMRRTQSRSLLLIAAVPTGVTWTLEVAGLAHFSNVARALAAVPLGAAAGWVFVQMLRYDFVLNGQIDHRGSRVGRC